MKLTNLSMSGLRASSLLLCSARADERRFTYTYEPETPPQGMWEIENWATWRGWRSPNTGQEHYHRLELRHELEYGVTDRYAVSLYLNEQYERFRDPSTRTHESTLDWTGVSLENRYMLLNPAEHAIGLTLYLEGRFAGTEAELEEKIIIGQRHGAWKWAVNLVHATEWENHLRDREGELELDLALARDLGKRWSVGVEVRNHNILPEYQRWENTALFVGPAISYHRQHWWTTLSVMPQVFGWNVNNPPGTTSNLEFADHEKVNVRWLLGFNF